MNKVKPPKNGIGIKVITILFCMMLGQVSLYAQGDQAILFRSTLTGTGLIYKMNSDGTNAVTLTNTASFDAGPIWSPDGSKVVFNRFVSANVTQLWIMNADGSSPTQLTVGPNSNQNPSFNADGSKILYSSCDTVNFVCDLYTMNADGTDKTLHPASHADGDDDQAFYSPDGTKIVWVGVTAANETRLYLANADGTGSTTILTSGVFPAIDLNPRFSNDNSKIAFTRLTGSGATAEIYRINVDGTGLTRLTNNAFSDSTPVWSPDGSKLAISSAEDGDNEIYTINSTDGSSRTRLTTNTISDIVSDWYAPRTTSNAQFDFDGDGRSDRSVFRPSDNIWYLDRSTDGFAAIQFGLASDALAPADYDGDGKTDTAVWRASEGNFYILNSSDSSVRVENFGLAGDILTVGDWDGDGKADLSVYREGSQSVLYFRGSLNNPTGGITFLPWGTFGDEPVAGDFDGDGLKDLAIFRPSNGVWYIRRSSDNMVSYVGFGIASDELVPADYDGDGKTDVAVYRNGVWYIRQSSNSQIRYEYFGISSDAVVPADYDGDGKDDVAVFRNGVWYIKQSTGGVSITSFGTTGDKAVSDPYVNQ